MALSLIEQRVPDIQIRTIFGVELVAEKDIHLVTAINQRRVMSAFVKQYVANKAPQ
ncbi:hypothetical protein GN958_ATG19736, partial [Phytophthora infestans]